MEIEHREIEPKVHIKTVTPDYIQKIWSAARNCYFKGQLSELENEYTEDRGYDLVEKLMRRQHDSCLEHIYFTIHLEGVSRSFMAQITRHRHVTFHVSSQHFQNHENFLYILPDFQHKISKNIFIDFMTYVDNTYKALLDNGERHFIARQILPNSVSCKIIMTLNLRELRYIIKLRRGPENVPEMQEIMKLLIGSLNRIDPIFLYKINGGK